MIWPTKNIIRILEKDGLTDKTRKILSGLTSGEALILRNRLGIHLKSNLTLDEVKKQFAVTREKIRAIEKKALKKLRDRDPDDDGPDAA